MLRLNCSTLDSRWFMFIEMKTAIKLDHVAIKCIKINSFSNCCRSHSLHYCCSSFFLPLTRKLFILLYWFKHIKLITLQRKITTFFFVTLNHYSLHFVHELTSTWSWCAFPDGFALFLAFLSLFDNN